MMLAAFLALAAASPTHCAPVDLALAEKQMPATFRGKPFRETSANFAKAYAKACAEGLLKAKPLTTSHRLFLINAPDANDGSIYSTGGRTVFEFWFVTHDGRVHVPSAGQIHEAIFCAVRGASEAEKQESGRCLPD
jgi:hypothetical protein